MRDIIQLPPSKLNGDAANAKISSSRWNGRFSITITLVAAVGLLTLVSVGSVLWLGVWLAHKNTFALLSENAHQSVTSAANRIRQHLEPAEDQARFLVERIEAGDVDPTDHQALGLLLTGALAAAPQIDTVMFIDDQAQSYYASYNSGNGKVTLDIIDYSRDQIIQENMKNIVPGVNWGPPIWRENTKLTYLNVSFPVLVRGKPAGAIVAVVSVEHLSDFVSEAQSGPDGQHFILSGREHVLAHPLMMRGYPGRTDKSPLPKLLGFSDPILAAIWRPDGREELGLNLPKDISGHMLRVFDAEYIFIYKEMPGFGPRPLLAGVYYRLSDVSEEIERLMLSLVAGIAALALSLLAAVLLGRKIAQPIVGFSIAASRIRDLEASKVKNLPPSMFRGLNDQSRSFNTMLRALRWFELYVPKKLVGHLVKHGDESSLVSDHRNITVMFTDMVGYSAISQGMSAKEVAELLNHHFSLIGECIDAEEGTIDKYIGDSVMAFWGAPEKQKNRAERACRTALAIASAIRKDNAKRAEQGKPAIGIRIGIHSGDATVGNIGAPGRINYTIIGDDVNIGQRLEQLGKEVYPPGTDVSILISADTAEGLGAEFKPVLAGKFELKGREGKTKVYKL